MPIISRKPTTSQSPDSTKKSDNPHITHPNYQGVTTDTKLQPLSSLMTHIEGSSWIVKYYQQALGRDSELSPQQLDKHEVYQQYIEISNLELKVSSALSQSQDEESKAFEVVGEANLYPPVIPNKGDMFLADIGDGNEGLFAVTESSRLTILKQSCHRISYVLVAYSTEERRADLAKKTVKKTHYVKKLLEHGSDPIVVNDDYHRYLSFTNMWDSLVGQYFGRFYNKTIASLAVPDQKCLTFDHFLVKTIQSFMDSADTPIIRTIKNYSIGLPDQTPPITVWDSLLRFSLDLLPLSQEKLGLVNSRLFGIVPQFEGISFTNVDLVVYPVDESIDCFEFNEFTPGVREKWDIRHQFDCTSLGSMLSAIDTEDNIPLIHPVTKDDYYVFSEAFYFNIEDQQSQLERLVRNAIIGHPIDQKTLYCLCENSVKWSRLDKFYFIPVLLILVKMVKRGH